MDTIHNNKQVKSSKKGPNISMGPKPLLLSRKEVDTLYIRSMFEAVINALKVLNIDYIVTGGTLLGSIR